MNKVKAYDNLQSAMQVIVKAQIEITRTSGSSLMNPAWQKLYRVNEYLKGQMENILKECCTKGLT